MQTESSTSHRLEVLSVRLSTVGKRAFPVSGTTVWNDLPLTSHLRRLSRFSDNDSRPFCFPVPTKTLSYDSCVTVTIHHYCLDTCGPCNNLHYIGHVKNVFHDDDEVSSKSS